MKFVRFAPFWVTDFRWPDISFGVHVCMRGRIDLHILKWMISVGRVPVYRDGRDQLFAASNSYHDGRVRNALRAGSPDFDERRNQ